MYIFVVVVVVQQEEEIKKYVGGKTHRRSLMSLYLPEREPAGGELAADGKDDVYGS